MSNKPKRRKLTLLERKRKADEREARRTEMFGARRGPAYKTSVFRVPYS